MKLTVTQLIDIKFMISNSCYGVTKDGQVFNTKTGRKLKRVVIGTTKGYCINSKFTSLSKLRSMLVKVENNNSPF